MEPNQQRPPLSPSAFALYSSLQYGEDGEGGERSRDGGLPSAGETVPATGNTSDQSIAAEFDPLYLGAAISGEWFNPFSLPEAPAGGPGVFLQAETSALAGSSSGAPASSYLPPSFAAVPASQSSPTSLGAGFPARVANWLNGIPNPSPALRSWLAMQRQPAEQARLATTGGFLGPEGNALLERRQGDVDTPFPLLVAIDSLLNDSMMPVPPTVFVLVAVVVSVGATHEWGDTFLPFMPAIMNNLFGLIQGANLPYSPPLMEEVQTVFQWVRMAEQGASGCGDSMDQLRQWVRFLRMMWRERTNTLDWLLKGLSNRFVSKEEAPKPLQLEAFWNPSPVHGGFWGRETDSGRRAVDITAPVLNACAYFERILNLLLTDVVTCNIVLPDGSIEEWEGHSRHVVKQRTSEARRRIAGQRRRPAAPESAAPTTTAPNTSAPVTAPSAAPPAGQAAFSQLPGPSSSTDFLASSFHDNSVFQPFPAPAPTVSAAAQAGMLGGRLSARQTSEMDPRTGWRPVPATGRRPLIQDHRSGQVGGAHAAASGTSGSATGQFGQSTEEEQGRGASGQERASGRPGHSAWQPSDTFGSDGAVTIEMIPEEDFSIEWDGPLEPDSVVEAGELEAFLSSAAPAEIGASDGFAAVDEPDWNVEIPLDTGLDAWIQGFFGESLEHDGAAGNQ